MGDLGAGELKETNRPGNYSLNSVKALELHNLGPLLHSGHFGLIAQKVLNRDPNKLGGLEF